MESKVNEDILRLLWQAERLVREEILRIARDGNNRYQSMCLVEAQLDIGRAIEDLMDREN